MLLDGGPHSLSQTVTPSRTPSGVTYFMDISCKGPLATYDAIEFAHYNYNI